MKNRKMTQLGCDFSSGIRRNSPSPTISICKAKPAVFIRSKRLNQEVAVCKKCFAFLDSTNYEFKENFQDNPKAEY